jgi:hypothetical protein
METSRDRRPATLKAADTVATQVDAAVMQTIDQSMNAIKNAGPEVANGIRQGLYNYLKKQGLTGSELEAAGVPRGFFNDIEQTTGKGDNFFAMSKADEGERLIKKGSFKAGDIQYQIDDATGQFE